MTMQLMRVSIGDAYNRIHAFGVGLLKMFL